MHVTIYGELCDLNTYIKAERGHRQAAAAIKLNETERVAQECMVQKIKAVSPGMYPVALLFTWYTKDAKKDVDNVTFAKKFIADGLVLAGVIENDSRKFVRHMQDVDILIDKHSPRVEVQIVPV